MKCTEREVMKLVQELDNQNTGFVNYNEFLKYSYLCQMYIYHYKLEIVSDGEKVRRCAVRAIK